MKLITIRHGGPLRVLYIYDGDWPRGATRVRKETRALADAGHEILLLSRNETRQPRDQREPWMAVRRLPTFPTNLLNRALNFPLPVSPIWAAVIRSACRRFAPDAILVEDLPLAPLALAAGRRTAVPVFYDMGEVYPEFLRGMRQFGTPSFADRVLRNPGPAERLERYVLRRADHTFVVSEESFQRATARGGNPARMSIVGNGPEDPDALTQPCPRPPQLIGLEGRPIVLFVGILISDRGIDVAVRSMAILKSRFPRAALVIVGDGMERETIEQEVLGLGLSDHVFLTGWQDHADLPGFYQHADVGLLPFRDGGQIRYTLANKLFDYMAAGLPVVATDVPPMRRVLGEARIGEIVRAGDPESLAEGIGRLLGATALERERMGAAGRLLVRTKYRWSLDAERLVSAVERVVGTYANGPQS